MNKDFYKSKKYLIFLGIMFFITIFVLIVGKTRASLREIKSVEFSSSGYADNVPGSWHITKSAEWTSTDIAKVRFDVDTIIKTYDRNKDILLILDNSGSMSGEKLNRVKEDAIDLINTILLVNGNKVALISFESNSAIRSDFTDDKDKLINYVNNLSASGCTNYNAALKNALILMENYVKEEDKDLKMLFLTDGFPNTDVPNQITTYEILKEKYPYMEVNGIQYEMGEKIIQDIIKISDFQYIADQETLNNILLDASINRELYDEFIVTDYVNDEYFYIKSVDDIKVNKGTVSLEDENGTQKIIWNLGNDFFTGQKAWMDIDLTLKEEYLNTDEFYPTNKKETVVSKVVNEEEQTVNETVTPVLERYHNVIYDNNAPSGCSIPNIENNNQRHYVFERVAMENETLSCEGWIFKGWYIENDDVKTVNSDVFVMPDHDVKIKALWGKQDLSKSMDGNVKSANTIALLDTGRNVNAKMKSLAAGTNITYNTSDNLITAFRKSTVLPSSIITRDENIISEANSLYPVYIWFDDSSGTIYYYTEADTIMLNSRSSEMFRSLTSLIDISGVEYFDTTELTYADSMFGACTSLEDITPIANWDVSNVIDMSSLFYQCYELANISVLANWNVSNVRDMGTLFYSNNITDITALANWDVSNVKKMEGMFRNCTSLVNITPLSNWNVSSVTNMKLLFSECSSLTSVLALSNWNVSNVTNMSSLFSSCTNLTSLNGLQNWNVSNVEVIDSLFKNCSNLIDISALTGWNVSNANKMFNMFWQCSSLTNISALTNWDVSNVTDISAMFLDCNNLVDITPLTNWNVSSVTDMHWLFNGCSSLTSIISLANWNVSNVTTMNGMFKDCENLVIINPLANWSVSNVTNMDSLFYNCKSITNVTSLANWNVTNVTDMDYIFYYCWNLESLSGLENWNISNVTSIVGAFAFCENLINISPIENWNTSNITSMGSLFRSASITEPLSLANWNMSNVININSMFNRAVIPSIDISGWNTSSITNTRSMFEYSDIPIIYTSNSVDFSNVENSDDMFKGATNIQGGNGTTYDENHIDKEYARIDTAGHPGYFTLKQ